MNMRRLMRHEETNGEQEEGREEDSELSEEWSDLN